MSYKAAVLYDYPIAYYPLDDITTADLVTNFTDLLSQFATYQDLLDNVSSYSNLYGDTAYDYSGCGNNGLYIGDPKPNIIPIVKGGSQGCLITNINSLSLPITKNYTGTEVGTPFARSGFSDNDFSLEIWIYPQITVSETIPILADTNSNIGIYWENGTIVFRLQDEYLYYTPSYIKKVFHIVAVYNVYSMTLYVDGISVANKPLSGFLFTNENLTLTVGPILNAANTFIADDIAVYRYALDSSRILNHFFASSPTSPVQVVVPDSGVYFPLSDDGIRKPFVYSYPGSKSWTAFVNADTYFDPIQQSLSLIRDAAGGSKSVEFIDNLLIPSGLGLLTSKIEWDGDNGVSVYTSLDGLTYIECENGKAIPQYKLSSFDSSGVLYIKFVLSSTDISKYVPFMRNLIISFYQNKDIIGYNTGSKVVYSQDEYHLGSAVYNILFRDSKNGLRCNTDSGFVINTDKAVRTLEFFYTPSGFTDSGLVSSISTNGYTASNYSWRNTGTVSKTNISAIYINGVNKTSQTSISNVFTDGQLHHVVIVYSSPISEDITFNYSLYGATQGLYQNIGIYETAFDQAKATEHYALYTSMANQTSSDSTFTVTETSVKYYDNDWLVIQNI